RAALHRRAGARAHRRQRNHHRPARARAQSGDVVRARPRPAGAGPGAGAGARRAVARARAAPLRPSRARPVRCPPAAGSAVGATARTPARPAGRRRGAWPGAARRPPAGTCLAKRTCPQHHRTTAAAPRLAAAAPGAAARPPRPHPGRPRTDRIRLVGGGRAPRLLPGRDQPGPARLGVPRGRRSRRRRSRRRFHAARLVRLSTVMGHLPDYAELHCLSAFSFQRGASVAPELFERAKQQGYTALAITDECSLAGIVRALEASKRSGVGLIVGSEVQVEDGPKLVLLVEDKAGYTALCQLITRARRRASKGHYRLLREDFAATDGLLALWVPDATPDEEHAGWTRDTFPNRTWLAVELHRGPDDKARLAQLRNAGDRLGLPLVAAGDVHMHVRGRRALQDTMTAIRHHVTVAEAGHRLFPNGERHLRGRRALAAIYGADLLAETVRIAGRCRFDMRRDLQYQYPHELVPPGHDAGSWLRHLVEEGA